MDGWIAWAGLGLDWYRKLENGRTGCREERDILLL